MSIDDLYSKALSLYSLSIEEGVYLFKNAKLEELLFVGNELRKKHVPGNYVGWIVDRNVNITNVCISRCKFCNFHRLPGSDDSYITTIEEYKQKIDALFALGGDQILLQGGLHPKLGLTFYKELFGQLKSLYPKLKLHALGPAEIAHIAKLEKTSYREVLEELIKSGLDSLPGAGAEILCDRVRTLVSPGKCKSNAWLDVMLEAHKLNLPTSATMMFGHAETIEERFEHFVKLREVQAQKPEGHFGFITFVPWPYQDTDTLLREKMGVINNVTGIEYLRMIAMSRIMLNNIENIQASWLTMGKDTGQLALHAGANDFGSIMIEENVVSAAGANHQFDEKGICDAIIAAGFIPKRRNQKYEYLGVS